MLEDTNGGESSGVRTFLIADVRGYTRFSQEQGDEAASALAQRFAEIVRATVPAAGGELVELRGDEALCVFHSARKAVAAAVELQRRLRERVRGEPALLLGVGIGLDAGEAVPTEGGYRGRALNVAARLCSLARAGEILASETVSVLAGSGPGASYASRRPARLKGLSEPVRHVEVVPDIELPPLPTPPQRSSKRRISLFERSRERRLLLLIGVPLCIAVALAAVVLSRSGKTESIDVASNSVAVIDPETNRIVADIAVGGGPQRTAVGEGRVWVLNSAEQTISVIDAQERTLIRTFSPAATPAGIAVGGGSVWIGDSVTRSVLQLDPETGVVVGTIPAPPLTPPPVRPGQAEGGAIAFGMKTLWFLSGNTTVSRIDPAKAKVVRRIHHSGTTSSSVAVGEGAIWVTGCCAGMTRIDPQTNARSYAPVGADGPLAVGLGGVWIADLDKRGVWQVDPLSNELIGTTGVSSPIDVAVGAGSVWAASADGTVSRIDPRSGDVTATIHIGGTPAGIAFGAGAVWVAVD